MKKIFLLLVIFLFAAGSHAQWQQTNAPINVSYASLAANQQSLFAATSDSGIYRSSDNGNSWAKLSNGLDRLCFNSIILNPATGAIYAVADSNIFKSTNNGDNWLSIKNGLQDARYSSLLIKNDSLFLSSDSGAFRSMNDGANWEPINNGLTSPSVRAFIYKDGYLFAGLSGAGPGTGHGIFRSTDNGDTWEEKNNGVTSDVDLFEILSDRIYAVSGTIILYSTDLGESWNSISNGLASGLYIEDLHTVGDYIFASQRLSGVFVQHKDSTDWRHVSEGLPSTFFSGVSSNDEYSFVGVYQNGIWRRLLSEIFTGVEEQNIPLPNDFELSQNYPNPFNSSTNIRFGVVGSDLVSLKVFDILGRNVATLVNERKKAGTYTVKWDATELPSGVYFYKLTTGTCTAVHKMLLLK